VPAVSEPSPVVNGALATGRTVILQNTQLATLCSILFSMTDEQITTALSTKDTAMQKLQHVQLLMATAMCEVRYTPDRFTMEESSRKSTGVKESGA